jgi:hypothetical protein
MDTYAHSAISYIKKLIHIQQHIPDRYIRRDENAVLESIRKLKPLVDNNHYSDDQARLFWIEKRRMIKTLIPSENYSGFAKLIREFSELDETQVWNSVSNSLSN